MARHFSQTSWTSFGQCALQATGLGQDQASWLNLASAADGCMVSPILSPMRPGRLMEKEVKSASWDWVFALGFSGFLPQAKRCREGYRSGCKS